MQKTEDELKVENKRLKMLLNLREDKIVTLQAKIEDLNKKYKKKIDLNMREKSVRQEEEAFQARRIKAYYYEKLMQVLEENEFLKFEWVKFMTYVKLIVDPEVVKELGG